MALVTRWTGSFFQETEAIRWQATYPASGTLSNSRHCAFLLARVLAGIDVGRRLSVLGGWWFSSSANFGGLPMQRNGFCDWQSRGIGEDCTYWKIQAGHEDERFGKPLPEPKI
jgi:hypothetical protein